MPPFMLLWTAVAMSLAMSLVWLARMGSGQSGWTGHGDPENF